MIVDRMDIGEMRRRLLGGERIMVICKSRADAYDQCDLVYRKLLHRHDASELIRDMCRIALRVNADLDEASIEFGWVESATGRRVDDVSVACLALDDPMTRRHHAGVGPTPEGWAGPLP